LIKALQEFCTFR